jgi:hypothetical protein
MKVLSVSGAALKRYQLYLRETLAYKPTNGDE